MSPGPGSLARLLLLQHRHAAAAASDEAAWALPAAPASAQPASPAHVSRHVSPYVVVHTDELSGDGAVAMGSQQLMQGGAQGTDGVTAPASSAAAAGPVGLRVVTW